MDLPDYRTVKNKCLLFISHGPWYIVIAVQTDKDMDGARRGEGALEVGTQASLRKRRQGYRTALCSVAETQFSPIS